MTESVFTLKILLTLLSKSKIIETFDISTSFSEALLFWKRLICEARALDLGLENLDQLGFVLEDWFPGVNNKLLQNLKLSFPLLDNSK